MSKGITELGVGKKGKLYFRFVVAVALLAAAIYSISALTSLPSSQPRIVTSSNFSSSLNVTVGFASTNLFGFWKLDGNANYYGIKEDVA